MTISREAKVLTDKLSEDWRIIERTLPAGWQEKAHELGALRRTRGIKHASHLLRVMLIHLAEGCGLRETAVRAKLAGIADISDVAILKRLNGCGAWFEWMARGLQQTFAPPAPLLAGRQLRIVDGTIVHEPGSTGSQWRLHYSINLPALNCDEVILTTPKEGETLKRYHVNPGDIMLADRGYAHPAGIAHVVDRRGDVIIRANLVTLPFLSVDGTPFEVLAHLRELDMTQIGDWNVLVRAGKRLIAGRLCAIRKSVLATEKARRRVRRESQRMQSQVQPQTIEAAGYVFVFTTLAAAHTAERVMTLYRARWQIELKFKRMKSLLGLGHLKKHDDKAARAWLQGKLLVACLIDTLLATAEHISPWGFSVEGDTPKQV